ncbi:MAG TPA: Uma2 family endonuclease [Thermoanaerobaculia bacterium]|nr:Uma2 family endonuclease [Thermoanaerobaculia bacterium]
MKTTTVQGTRLDAAHLEGNPDAPLVIPGVSEKEYYALEHGIRYQYLGGDLVKEPVGLLHDGINSFVLALLKEYVYAREPPGAGALVTSAGFPMRLDSKWSPEPDVMVIREERRHLVSRQRLEGPADLAIEIASYSHPRIDLKRKLPRYRQARVPEIWVIEPYAKFVQVEVLRAGGPHGGDAAGTYETRTLSSGRLTTAALAGFWLEVAWLWQEPLPSVLACLRQILA